MPSFSSLLRRSAFALVVIAATAGPAAAQRPRFHYAVNILCGVWRDSVGLLQRQEYMTSVNIHNPTDSVANFRKSLIVTVPPGLQRPMMPAHRIAIDTLQGGFALESDCKDMRRVFSAPAAFQGFMILDSFVSLNVVATYTVEGGVNVVTVPERVR